jgi:hypothetical protein
MAHDRPIGIHASVKRFDITYPPPSKRWVCSRGLHGILKRGFEGVGCGNSGEVSSDCLCERSRLFIACDVLVPGRLFFQVG